MNFFINTEVLLQIYRSGANPKKLAIKLRTRQVDNMENNYACRHRRATVSRECYSRNLWQRASFHCDVWLCEGTADDMLALYIPRHVPYVSTSINVFLQHNAMRFPSASYSRDVGLNLERGTISSSSAFNWEDSKACFGFTNYFVFFLETSNFFILWVSILMQFWVSIVVNCL